MWENGSHRTEWTTVGTEGPEKDTCCRTQRRAGDPEKVTLKKTVLRMTSEESDIRETDFFVYDRLK
jgi:hypothetical protein